MFDLISIDLMEGVGVASVLARKVAADDTVIQRPGTDGPVCHREGRCTFLGVGPGHWLAMEETPSPNFVGALNDQMGHAAWVVDQSGAYRIFKIAGASARAMLQSGVPIDLHPDVFGLGAAASTSIAHMSVLLWRLDDGEAFAAAVFRSYEASFRRWLDQAVAAL